MVSRPDLGPLKKIDLSKIICLVKNIFGDFFFVFMVKNFFWLKNYFLLKRFFCGEKKIGQKNLLVIFFLSRARTRTRARTRAHTHARVHTRAHARKLSFPTNQTFLALLLTELEFLDIQHRNGIFLAKNACNLAGYSLAHISLIIGIIFKLRYGLKTGILQHYLKSLLFNIGLQLFFLKWVDVISTE